MFCMELHDDYRERFNRFFTDYKVLHEDFGVSITVKAHDVFFHIIDWLDRWQVPLGLVSEQAGESIHSKFNKHVQDKQVASPNHPSFGENLLKVSVAWNSIAALDFE